MLTPSFAGYAVLSAPVTSSGGAPDILLRQGRTSPTNSKLQADQDSREEGMTKPITTQKIENIWHGSSDPQKIL